MTPPRSAPGLAWSAVAAGDLRGPQAGTYHWFSMTRIASATTVIVLADTAALDLEGLVASFFGRL